MKKPICLIFILVILFSSVFAEYPEYTDLYINDFAGILSEKDSEAIRAGLIQLKEGAGIEAVVVTVSSFIGYETGDLTFESFATGLFNSWGVGDAELNNGIMVLVGTMDRKVRIELGTGYGTAYNSRCKGIIDNDMIPYFKKGNYSAAVLHGVNSICTSFGAGGSVPLLTEAADSAGQSSGTMLLVILGIILVLAVAAKLIISRILRYRPVMCAQCGEKMTLLGEAAEDEHLEQGQRTEEIVSSADYDVWVCPSCSHKLIRRYRKWLTRSRGCVKCGYRTLWVTRRIIDSPTYDYSGTGEERGSCANCGYRYSRTYHIPRRIRWTSSSGSGSSSSSSGSFGGGHSSGSGGASGSW